MKAAIKTAIIASALLASGGCAHWQMEGAAPEGSLVGLGETVALASGYVTPISVHEDSRCPIDATCVWAGRVVVEIEVRTKRGTQRDWAQSDSGVLIGSPPAYDFAVVLEEVLPAAKAGKTIAPQDYRFRFRN